MLHFDADAERKEAQLEKLRNQTYLSQVDLERRVLPVRDLTTSSVEDKAVGCPFALDAEMLLLGFTRGTTVSLHGARLRCRALSAQRGKRALPSA